MAAAVGISEASVRRIWRAHGNRIAWKPSRSATILVRGAKEVPPAQGLPNS
jgi:hypothetical protein